MNDTFDDARVLAQHSAALRRLARGLVSDPNTADDLVQDTWLGALRRWRRHGVATGPGGLRLGVRHRAISARRRHGAEELDDADTFAGSVGGPSETAATLERYRVLHEELGALREPYRGTLVARFIEEQPHAAIARSQGIAADTVRTRITRGLALLREQLDRRFEGGGGRSAWMAAIAPLAAREVTAKALSATAILAVAGVASVAVGLVAVITLASREPSPSPLIESRVVSDTTGDSGDQQAVEPLTDDATSRSTGALPGQDRRSVESTGSGDAPTLLAIRGVAVDQGGRPVEGIAYAWARPPWGSTTFSVAHDAKRTDAQGRFEVVLDPSVRSNSVQNVVFSDSSSESDARQGAWHHRPVGALRRARPGSSGHVVRLEVASGQPGRVIGICPTLEPEVEIGNRSIAATLEADAFAYGASCRYHVSNLEPRAPFTIDGVAPGVYSLTVGGNGQRPMLRGNIVVRAGETTEIDALTYGELGTVVFDHVELTASSELDEVPKGIGGWITSDAGFSSAAWVDFGEDEPLSGDMPELCAGEWSIHWDTEGLIAPRTRFRIKPGQETRLSLDVVPARPVDISVRPPEDDAEGPPCWSVISYQLEDARGRSLAYERPVIPRDGSGDSEDAPRTMTVSLPLDERVLLVVTTDGGHETRLWVNESTLRDDAPPPMVQLR